MLHLRNLILDTKANENRVVGNQVLRGRLAAVIMAFAGEQHEASELAGQTVRRIQGPQNGTG